jgi:hypothetical protein
MIPRRGRRSYDRIRVVLSKILVRGIINPFIGPCLACVIVHALSCLLITFVKCTVLMRTSRSSGLIGESFQMMSDQEVFVRRRKGYGRLS